MSSLLGTVITSIFSIAGLVIRLPKNCGETCSDTGDNYQLHTANLIRESLPIEHLFVRL